MIILYSRSTCQPCKSLKYWLSKRGVEFEERSVDEPANETALNQLGYTSVPVTLVGDEIVVGANFSALNSLLTNQTI